MFDSFKWSLMRDAMALSQCIDQTVLSPITQSLVSSPDGPWSFPFIVTSQQDCVQHLNGAYNCDHLLSAVVLLGFLVFHK